jgi:hypothetical protein
VSFFLSFSLLLLLLLPVFCFFFWWGQFVWQQKKQKGSSIDKRGGEKNCASEYPPWSKRQEVCQFLLTHAYLDTKKLHWFFLLVHSFCTQTHHTKIPFPHSIPIHVEESQIWCCLSSTQERRIKSPKFPQTREKQIIACEFHSSSLIVCDDSVRDSTIHPTTFRGSTALSNAWWYPTQWGLPK